MVVEKTIRVLIADEQPLVRNGLRMTLGSAAGISIVADVSDGREAVRLAERMRPDVVLMDVKMPQQNALDATRTICRMHDDPGSKVIILTTYDEDEYVFDAIRAGASGYLLKDGPTELLVSSVREVASGGGALSPSVIRSLMSEFARRPALPTGTAPKLANLTERELDVFKLLIRGYRNEDMARALTLGESTIKSHVQHLYQKLGVRDRVQVVIYAYENGLL